MMKNYDSLIYLQVKDLKKVLQEFYLIWWLRSELSFCMGANRKSTCFTTIILLFSMYTLAVGI